MYRRVRASSFILNSGRSANSASLFESIVAEIANDLELTLILGKDQTVLVATQLEITDQVLQRLDAQLPTVEVADPGT